MLKSIINIDNFKYICHEETINELDRYDRSISEWVVMCKKIYIISDEMLLNMLVEHFGTLGFIKYIEILKKCCYIFSSKYYKKYYYLLEQYIIDNWLNWHIEEFIYLLKICEQTIGIDNNQGEIKLYLIVNIFDNLNNDYLYVFCSDDRRARIAISNQNNIDCVSSLSSFYLLKKYLNIDKNIAQLFFDSWKKIHSGQKTLKIYNKEDYTFKKIGIVDFIDLLYDDKFVLQKDGFFKEK